MGISNSYLSEIEKNKKAPSLDLLKKYADILGIQSSCNIEDGKYPEIRRIIKDSQAVARFKKKTKVQS